MKTPVAPGSIPELLDVIRSANRVFPMGCGTKPRLSRARAPYVPVSSRALRGVQEYEPDEYTVTALAGTPLRDLVEVLTAAGQHLPFDPLLTAAGATLGGAVAAGLNGPGRFRFGGIRDFILGVRFIDGQGQLLRAGGKVVKNAAGFDLPKFLTGSLGRFGFLAEITLKVLPCPASTLTLRLQAADAAAAAAIVKEASNSRWQPDAIDIPPSGSDVCMRLAGPLPALEAISREILTRHAGEVVEATDAHALWTSLTEMLWAHTDGILLKVPITLAQTPALLAFVRGLPDARAHISGGGNVAYLSIGSTAPVDALRQNLQRLELQALVLRGEAPIWLGVQRTTQIATAVKRALDPCGRFPELDEDA